MSTTIIIIIIISKGKLLKYFKLDHLLHITYCAASLQIRGSKAKSGPLKRMDGQGSWSLTRRIGALTMTTMREHSISLLPGCYNIKSRQHTCPQLYPAFSELGGTVQLHIQHLGLTVKSEQISFIFSLSNQSGDQTMPSYFCLFGMWKVEIFLDARTGINIKADPMGLETVWQPWSISMFWDSLGLMIIVFPHLLLL